MCSDWISKVRAAMSHSELVQAVTSVRHDGGRALALGNVPLRPLLPEEIRQLESAGSSCADWSRVRVAEGFDCRRVRQTSFHGDIVLGRFTRSVTLAQGLALPAGMERVTVANCVIGHEALVRDIPLLANYVIGEEAVVMGCGSVTCDRGTTFGNGEALSVGIESGGREVAIFAEIDVEIAAAVAGRRSDQAWLDQYAQAVAEYTDRVRSDRGIIGRGALVANTPCIKNAFIGPHARIEGATRIADSTILSSSEEPVVIGSGADVAGSVVQWGCHVTTMALVERSVLIEHSHAECHGKVISSILGPNTGVAKGETTACLLGPFVSAHHQSLLIATLWPEGKGNVSYGANVGANHTSKAPDQEFWPGEGTFLGLGVNIKFPADLTRAPYTIFACGVTTLPQKIVFPFSLVNKPSAHYPEVSPAYNEIMPAWLLTDNLFTLKRSEGKYQARNKARRQQYDFRVFRPEVIDLMHDASRRLDAVRHAKAIYTDRDIEGLGKNFLLESSRKAAIHAYRFFIRYYALLELKAAVEQAFATGEDEAAHDLLNTCSSDPAWEHPRRLLAEELGLRDVLAALGQLPSMLDKVAHDVERSKAKDDERGARIIDDYAVVHVEAVHDPFVQKTWDETRRLQQEVAELIERLESRSAHVA